MPNVLSFLVFAYAVLGITSKINKSGSRLLIITFLLLTFNFLDFFELCRGYGLSMAFLTLGFYYLLNYLNNRQPSEFMKTLFALQMALAANLTLAMLVVILTGVLLFFQWRQRLLFNLKVVFVHILNIGLTGFWVKLLLHYKEANLLDSGMGEDYWKVTFLSLLDFLYTSNQMWLQISTIILMALIGTYFFRGMAAFKTIDALFKPSYLFSFLFLLCVLIYFLLKKMAGINYPEDRTGLFLFLLFVLALAYTLEKIPEQLSGLLSVLLIAAISVNSIKSANLKNFGSYFYHTMPKQAYDYLVNEQSKSDTVLTIGGHRIRELNFAFLNYRGNAVLNDMDGSEDMQMCYDYFYALKEEKTYYNQYYDEIMADDWSHVLLKRKQKLKRTLFLEGNKEIEFKGSSTYFDFLAIKDTSLNSCNPLEAEVKLSFTKMPKPFNAFLVFSVGKPDGSGDTCYKYIPLNMLADDLDNKSFTLKLTSSSLPTKLKDLKIHIWNIDAKEVNFKLNYFKIHQLHGDGVNFKIPSNYRYLIERFTQKPVL
ncbi:MAG: hypothetical protein IM600_08585 [Bacteroidetes bacterium]|nr:hypothetical protein [Bacteroidota bacterium]